MKCHGCLLSPKTTVRLMGSSSRVQFGYRSVWGVVHSNFESVRRIFQSWLFFNFRHQHQSPTLSTFLNSAGFSMPYLSLAELLNPQPEGPVGHASGQSLSTWLSLAHTAVAATPPSVVPFLAPHSFAPSPPEIRHNVKINRKTTLSILNVFHDISAHVEYLSTNIDQPIGYLFRQDPADWRNPTLNFV